MNSWHWGCMNKCNAKKCHQTELLLLFLERTTDFSKDSLVTLPLWADESQKPLVIGERSHVRAAEKDCVAAADRQNAVENSHRRANDDWWQRRPFILTAEEWMSHSSGDNSKSVRASNKIRGLSRLWNAGSVYLRTPTSSIPFLRVKNGSKNTNAHP